MSIRLHLIVPFVASLPLITGCGTDSGSPVGGVPGQADLATSDDPSSSDISEFGTPPSEEECSAFATEFETAASNQNTSAIRALIDWDALLRLATANVDVPAQFRTAFTNGFKQRLSQGGMGVQLVAAVQSGGSYELLRVHNVDGQNRALFRLVHASEGLNYHDIVLIKNSAGQVRAVDFYIFATAENLSSTLRRVYVMAASAQSRSLIEKLTGPENAFATHADDLQSMAQHIQTGNFQGVLNMYDRLPAELQKEKFILLQRMRAAAQVNDTVYAQAIADCRAQFPNDPCLDMISIDGYLLQGKTKLAIESVDRLDASVGGDPYLNVMRAGINLEAGNHEEARSQAEKSVEDFPDYVDAYWTLITVTMAQEDFAATALWLTTISERFDLEFGDLTALPEYAGFVKSPEYQKWLESQNGN